MNKSKKIELSVKSITIHHSHNKVLVSENGCAIRKSKVDCVDEETECSDARVQGEERIQQVLSKQVNKLSQIVIRKTSVYFP